MQERLQKILAQAGLCSRRTAEIWIEQGRVTVNGRKVSLGDRADPRQDYICVDGKPIGTAEQKVYLMLYKPRGYVTTLKDEHGRKTVAELTNGCGARVVPVGRLDYASEGLLLLTNDGELTNALTHPRHEVPKVYEVRVRGALQKISKLSEAMEIDGYQIQPAEVVLLTQDEQTAKLRLTIHEGRNRQIRKMCEQCGLEVRRLKRVAIGKLALDPALKAGSWRELTQQELCYLQETTANMQDE
ncbi:pseudouridine synthase [Agathobaculum sp.]|uniref:pseudouridine synthase n=1 Tax=Agathobaculum sp. TaxID=2048138 RepID=UPI002A80012E|nr:pseudouridine synthase [Agathobaculum sp.]MDY3618967.1 pseudouridine synthase [Agathobaculum sp.]